MSTIDEIKIAIQQMEVIKKELDQWRQFNTTPDNIATSLIVTKMVIDKIKADPELHYILYEVRQDYHEYISKVEEEDWLKRVIGDIDFDGNPSSEGNNDNS